MKKKKRVIKQSKVEIPGKKPNPWLIKLPNIIYYLLFFSVLFLGIYIRFDDSSAWKKDPSLFFHDGEPIYSEYDSFLFERLSHDIKEGIFKQGQIDYFRFFPDNHLNQRESHDDFTVKYSIPGSLLSFILHSLNQLTEVSVPWLSFYTLPFLAVTVAIPLFLYFKRINLPLSGILGGFVVLTSDYYYTRTLMMKLDTDLLNLTLPFLIAYFFLRFFESRDLKEKYLFVSLSSLALVFYYLWYGHSNINFIIIVTFFIAYLFEPLKNFILRKPINFHLSKHDIFYFSILVLPQLWYITSGPMMLIEQINTYVLKIKGTTSSDILFKDFPTALRFIAELKKEKFDEILSNIVHNKVVSTAGLFGAFLIFIFKFRSLIFVFPLFLIGLLVFPAGMRFGMYLAPFIGIGIGYLVHMFSEKVMTKLLKIKDIWRQKLSTAIVGLFIIVILLTVQKEVIEFTPQPMIPSPLVKEMKLIREITPDNAAIWSWWDLGYAFQLYSRRTVFHDGGFQNNPKTYLIARSFTIRDPKEAWLITSFVANHGLSGLSKILRDGTKPQELIEKIKNGDYYKPLSIPVYWVFTGDLLNKFGTIHYLGSFDMKKKEGILTKFGTLNCIVHDVNNIDIIECPKHDGMLLDLKNGLIKGKHQILIKNLYLNFGNSTQRKNYHERGIDLAIISKNRKDFTIIIAEPPTENTLFFQMFLLRQYDSKYFELLYDNFPHMVVYRVIESTN